MFDTEMLAKQMREDLREKFILAMVNLYQSGAIEFQIAANKAGVLEGGASESDERLAERIKEMRRQNAYLDELKSVASEYMKE